MACALNHSNIKVLLRVKSPDFGVKWAYVDTPHMTLKHYLERSQNLFLHPPAVVIRLNSSHKEPDTPVKAQ